MLRNTVLDADITLKIDVETSCFGACGIFAARRYSGGKSATLGDVHLVEWRNFLPYKKCCSGGNIGQGRLCPMPPPPEQLPDLGRSLTGRQSGQTAPQARSYHWIAAWKQVVQYSVGAKRIKTIHLNCFKTE